MSAAVDAYAEAKELIFSRKHVDPFEVWINKHYYLPPESSQSKGENWKSHGYQHNLAYVMGDLSTPEVNIIKGTQLGLSHAANAFALYEVTERGRSVGNWLPRNEDALYYSTVVLSNSIKHIKSVSDQLKVEPDKKDAENTNKRKGFKKGNIFSRSSDSPSSYDMIPIATAIQDEASRMPRLVKNNKDEVGESPFDKIKSRMEAAEFRKHICFSSPEEVGNCAIDELFQKSQVQLEEQIPCPNCDTYIPLEFGDAKTKHGMKWDRVEGEHGKRDNRASSMTAWYQCPCCDGRIDYHQMSEIDDDRGELRNSEVRLCVEDRCYYRLDENGNCTGEVIDKPYSVGIRIPALFSRTKTWFDGVYEYLEAVDASKEQKISKMMTFVKKYTARAYEHIQSVAYIKHEFLMARAENYSECPQEVQAITGWWDLQPEQEYIHGGYVGWGYGEEAWILRNIIKLGSPITTNVLDVVDEMFDHEFVKPNGETLKPIIAGIDSGNKPDPAYNKSRSIGITKCIPTKGTDRVGDSIIKFPNKPSPNNRTYLTLIGTVQAKDTIYERYKMTVPGPGYIHIPGESEEFSEDFYKGLVSEVKKVQNGKLQWCETGVRNEVLDWMVGNLAMVRIIQQPKYGFKFVEYTETENQALNQKAKSVMNTEDIASLWR